MYNERDVYKQESKLNELNEGHVPFGGIIKRFHRVYYVCHMCNIYTPFNYYKIRTYVYILCIYVSLVIVLII